MSSLLVVVGLQREARIVGADARVLLGGRGLDAIMAEKPAAFLSFGLCGGLDPALEIGDLVLGETVTTAHGCFAADPVWTDELAKSVPGAIRTGITAGADIVGSREAKAALRDKTGAGAVDMESHLVAEAAASLGVPFAVLRSVSDGAADSLSSSARAGFALDGRPNLAAVAFALMARPFELPSLIRTARNATAAFRALGACKTALAWSPSLVAPLSPVLAPA